MIIYAYYGIKDSFLMHVIIFMSAYISLYQKLIIISKYNNLGLILMT